MRSPSIASAFGFSFLHRYAEAIIRLVSLAVLSRLVAPEAFGVFAAAYALILLGMSLSRGGVEAWLVRLDRLDDGRATAGALIAAGVSAFFLVVAFLAGFALPAGPGRWVVWILGAGFLLLPVQAVGEALLRRKMQFGAICGLGLAAAIVGTAVGVILAAGGGGASALAAGIVAEGAVFAGGAGVVALRERAALWRRPAGLGAACTSCFQISLGNASTEGAKALATNFALVFISPAAAGFYDRGRRVVGSFNDLMLNAVRPVILPLLAQRAQDREALRSVYLFKLSALSGLAWPYFGVLFLAAEDVVMVLLGAQWTAAVPVTQAFCLLGLWLPFHVTDGKFFLALGLDRRYLTMQLVSTGAAAVFLFLGAQIGVAAMGVAYVLSKLVKSIQGVSVLAPRLGLTAGDMAGALLKSAPVAAAAIGTAALVMLMVQGETMAFRLLRLGLIGAIGGTLSLLVLIGIRHPLSTAVLKTLGQGRATGKPNASPA